MNSKLHKGIQKNISFYLVFVALFFLISISKSSYAEQIPNFIFGNLAQKLGANMDSYVNGDRFYANWIYKGKLSEQFQSIFTMSDDYPTKRLGPNLYITTGYRYQDATNRGAMVVDGAAHIYLAAIAQAATYSHGELQVPLPQLRVLVRDPKNLRYLPDIEQWAQSQPDVRGYVLTLYNLNCKAHDIAQCKMPVPPAAAH
jgi:hypothetical protein